MSIKPVRDLLYILPMDDPSEVGQIITRPKSHSPKIDQGIVKYRGPDTTGEVQIGDHVLFSSWAGDEMVVEDEGRLVLLREKEVDCILLDGPPSITLTIPQVKLAVKRAVAEVARTEDHRRDSLILDKILQRLLEHMDDRFFQELY